MQKITTLDALSALYPRAPSEASLKKVTSHLTPLYQTWIEASKFCILSTIGPEGTDASPRGDAGPVVQVLDGQTLAMPDWRGNNRLDSLRNIVVDGRVSLMFFVSGCNTVVRVNGTAFLTDDAAQKASFAQKGREPATVIIFKIAEVYTQCARALMRADFWQADAALVDLPTPGAILDEITSGEIDGAAYDTEWPARAERSMW